jgi:hypothetical protein
MIAHLLNQTVSIANKTGRNSEGQPTYGTPTSTSARVQETTQRVTNSKGMEVKAALKIFLPSPTTINIDDKVTFGSVDYTVVEKNKPRIEDGSVNHIEILVL